MNVKRLYFVDFDGTLFNRKVFWNAVQKHCEVHFSISSDRFQETYTESKDESGTYDIDRHAATLGMTHEEMVTVCKFILAKKSYAFPEVAQFLENHSRDTIVILTQGVSWYQTEKINSITILGNVRTVTTERKKREYIENNVGFYENGVMWEGEHYDSLTFIDNMPDAFLPEEYGTVLKQYRIHRPKEDDAYGALPTQKYSTEVTSLLDIQ